METKIKILIVEDETLVSFDLKNILLSLGYNVIGVVRTGEEAFSIAFEEKPDLILLDIMLGGKLNGIEAAEQIKKSIDVPIVYLTAYADKDTIQSAKVTEPYGYIIKPFEERALQSTIELALYKFKTELKLKESEKRYKQLAERLKEANESKDNFFSIISHELRGPFNSILGFAEILYNDLDELPKEELKIYVESLYHSSKHIYNLLNNLLHLTKFQAGKIDFNPQRISLNDAVEKATKMIKFSAEQKNILISKNAADNIHVYADEAMIDSIMMNLLSNSVKFTKRGGRIDISAEKKGEVAEIKVRDSGIGMNDETISNLFKIQMSKSYQGTEGETGTGLGLILVKKFVEQNGGSLKVYSRLNEGSIFSFSIPTID